MKKYLLILIIVTPFFTFAQENNFGITFGGFVKTDFMMDTRQNVTVREGHFLLYPENQLLDAEGEDINAKGNFNILSIQSRLTGKITAPDAFGAKISGILEGAFFGQSNPDINGFRLRHAFVKLDWGKHVVIVGQYWHPMFIVDVFPDVISFNTGVPFQPFSRNPQIRYTYKPSEVSISFTASSQRDFQSNGPEGAVSTYLRNSALPMLNVNAQYSTPDLVLGAGADYKSLLPVTKSALNYKSDETINSVSFLAYGKFKKDLFTIKAEGLIGENNFDLLMLGGYAVESTNSQTGIQSFTNIKIFSAWTDISYGSDIQAGVFAGYTKNNGSNNIITGNNYSRGSNIDKVFRLSPRIVVTEGKVKFAAELEYTSAAYGTPDVYGKVINTETVSNVRLLLSSFLSF
ncbi:MAG: hypothetical protein A2068_10430 [Ignavibacteria bacterium GWB2_35_6b]|nr:MAG: hypothetical protein A2068_10430 [Ignavibacteria bacterium GWB2_35_6b]